MAGNTRHLLTMTAANAYWIESRYKRTRLILSGEIGGYRLHKRPEFYAASGGSRLNTKCRMTRVGRTETY